MTVESKLDSVRALIQEHNDAIGEGNPGFVDTDDCISCLKAISSSDEAQMKRLKYEDIGKCLPDIKPGIKPIALAKSIAHVFRDTLSDKEEDAAETSVFVSSKKAQRMTPRELVVAFDPEEPDSKVGKRLKEMGKKQAFVVYKTGRTVDVDATVQLLMEIKQGFPARDHVTVDGRPKPVHQIGDLPDNYVDENPLYPGRPLRPDGTCDQTGRSWEGISIQVRQFLRVAMKEGDVKVNIEKAHELLDMVLGIDDPMAKLRERYATSSIKFDELEKMSKLPDLQVAIGNSKKGGEESRPFDQGAKVVWHQPNPVANYYVNTTTRPR